MLVLRDIIRLQNAYKVYLAACQHLGEVGKHAEPSRKKSYEFSKRTILYVPLKYIKATVVPIEPDVKAVKGTMKLRFLKSLSKAEVQSQENHLIHPQVLTVDDQSGDVELHYLVPTRSGRCTYTYGRT